MVLDANHAVTREAQGYLNHMRTSPLLSLLWLLGTACAMQASGRDILPKVLKRLCKPIHADEPSLSSRQMEARGRSICTSSGARPALLVGRCFRRLGPPQLP